MEKEMRKREEEEERKQELAKRFSAFNMSFAK